jgi:undecaprenyl phosphate-alpha-L-ara4N flippase subunit ArnE
MMILLTIVLRSMAAACAKEAALTSVGHGLLAMVVNVWFLAEILALFLQAIAWAFVLRRHALSLAYPFISLVFAVNMATAWLLFGETIRFQHILGIAVILVGVVIVSTSVKKPGNSRDADVPA